MNAKQILLNAAAMVEADPKTWIQGTSARDAKGHITYAESHEAVCWCALGAIVKLGKEDFLAKQNAKNALRCFTLGDIVTHNDEVIETPEQFVSWFRQAAELCE